MLFGNEEEEKDIGYLISQVESAKQRFKASLIIYIREELLDALEGARGSGCASAGEIE
jgi:hypothetical protein